MCTENERNVLQLAKKVFEHFTHDALPIAREIIAMEQQLGELPANGEEIPGASEETRDVKTTDEQPSSVTINNLPVTELRAGDLGIEADPMESNKDCNEELVFAPVDSLPF